MSGEKETATAPAEPHPLQPLHDQLAGAQHNAGSAIKALEAWVEAKFAALKAELEGKKEEDA